MNLSTGEYSDLESYRFSDPSHFRRSRAAGRLFASRRSGVGSPPPIYATCCAFASDRWFSHPELTHSATEEQVAELGDRYLCRVALASPLSFLLFDMSHDVQEINL